MLEPLQENTTGGLSCPADHLQGAEMTTEAGRPGEAGES
jgi:hypothetical protein